MTRFHPLLFELIINFAHFPTKSFTQWGKLTYPLEHTATRFSGKPSYEFDGCVGPFCPHISCVFFSVLGTDFSLRRRIHRNVRFGLSPLADR